MWMFIYAGCSLLSTSKAKIQFYLPLICHSARNFSFQAAGVSHTCPTSSLWGSRADPSPGVWFHAIGEHLPWAAPQEGVTSISQHMLQSLWIIINLRNLLLWLGSCAVDHLVYVCSGESYFSYLMYLWFIVYYNTHHVLCVCRLLCCSICTTWPR